MNQPVYRQRIIDYIRVNARPADKFGHQPRLYRLACELADGRPFDDDVVFAAAWMHDLGVFIGHRPEEPQALAVWDMLAYAERTVPGLLDQFGFPAQKIATVMAAILTHQPSKKPVFFEAVLIHDADILEQLGAIGICRTVAKVGRDTRFPLFCDAIKSLQRNVNELPSLLILESARRIAVSKRLALEEFILAFEAEVGECLDES
jgi:uncharacterized protein